MSSEQSNILKRQEQLNNWFDSETDKASNYIKEAEKIKFPKEVQFFSACNSNDWTEIERLLDEGIDINCTQDDGLTALHQACIDDDENLVRYLVTHGAKIDAQDKEGWTPLFAAISCNYLPITNYLLSCGARLDVVSFDGELPIDQSNNEAITAVLLKELAKRNLDPDIIRNMERMAMLNELDKMKRTKDSSHFFMVDNGATMLHVAASKDYLDVLEKLLPFITSEMLNHQDSDGWNALHVAAHWNNRRACVLLVEADIDFDSVTSSNQTVLEVADDEVKPYLREEIRKARFRREEKGSVKRPAQFPNGEYQPSETKIICQEKIAQIAVDSQKVNGDKRVSVAEEPISVPIDGDPNCIQRKPVEESVEPINNADNKDVKSNSNDTTHNMDICPSDTQTKLPTIKENVNTVNEKLNQSTKDKNELKPKTSVISPPIKSIESESQRKDKARHVRSIRRSTQGVTAEDIDEAKRIMATVQKNDKSNNPSVSEVKQDTTDVSPISNHSDSASKINKNTEIAQSRSQLDITNQLQKSDSSINDQLSIPLSKSIDLDDKRSRVRTNLGNKRRSGDRPPTGVIDLKDIQSAQSEILKSDLKEKENVRNDEPAKEIPMPNSSKSTDAEINYKLLYENECKEKEQLYESILKIRKELKESQEKIKNAQNSSIVSKNNIISQKPFVLPSDFDLREIEKLREENRKMKEANSALIRVISRLSHNPTLSKTVAGST